MLTRRGFIKGCMAAAAAFGLTPFKSLAVKGPLKYVGIIHPDVQKELLIHSGNTNPLFTGQLGVWNGVTIHKSKG